MGKLYVKYDSEPPYLPIAVEDSKTELARTLKVRPNVVMSAFSHGQSTYCEVEVEE